VVVPVGVERKCALLSRSHRSAAGKVHARHQLLPLRQRSSLGSSSLLAMTSSTSALSRRCSVVRRPRHSDAAVPLLLLHACLGAAASRCRRLLRARGGRGSVRRALELRLRLRGRAGGSSLRRLRLQRPARRLRLRRLALALRRRRLQRQPRHAAACAALQRRNHRRWRCSPARRLAALATQRLQRGGVRARHHSARAREATTQRPGKGEPRAVSPACERSAFSAVRRQAAPLADVARSHSCAALLRAVRARHDVA
jgi:hypothetical protein